MPLAPPAPGPPSSFAPGRLAALVVLLVGVFYGLSMAEGQDWGGDWSQYVSHAINLAEGKPYTEIPYFTNRLSYVAPGVYPPVFPLLLAPLHHIFGFNLEAYKSLTILAFCLCLGFSYAMFRERARGAGALLLIAILGFNPSLWRFKESILSDTPFVAFCLGTLLFMRHLYARRQRADAALRQLLPGAILLGFLMYLSYGLREVGLILPLTALAYELLVLRKLTPIASMALLTLIPLIFLQHLLLRVPAGDPELAAQLSALAAGQGRAYSHLNFFHFEPSFLWEQLLNYRRALWDFYYSGVSAPGGFWEGLAAWSMNGVTLMAAVGYLRSLWRGLGILEIFSAGYLAVVICFAGLHGMRYLLPLLPFLLFYASLGFNWGTQRLAPRTRQALVAGVALCVIGLYARSFSSGPSPEILRGVTSPEAQQIWSYLAEHAGPGDVVVSRRPRVVGLMSRLASCAFPRLEEPERVAEYLDLVGADYILELRVRNEVPQVLTEPQKRVRQAVDGRITLVAKNDYFQLYSYQPRAPAAQR